ncbi:MAG: uracil-DNA glycosylase [Chloroflexota bacterium]|nr:MAG: uracil-DNA glycosylase [Chloroflexota bacterium]
MNAEQSLKEIAQEISMCKKCALHYSRKNGVPGEGPSNADVVFIGEGPGFHENVQGRPFVGAAGQFFEELLKTIGMRREDVFITNVVKCRPPGNRDPEEEELQACKGYLDRQLAIIRPKMVVTLGRYSMARYISNAKISHIHGMARRVNGLLVVPFYHPAAALHRPSLRAVLEEDFAKLPELIANTEQVPEYAYEEKNEDQAEQLSMF